MYISTVHLHTHFHNVNVFALIALVYSPIYMYMYDRADYPFDWADYPFYWTDYPLLHCSAV